MAKISIIMPAFNAGKYLEDSISSVLRQSFTDWELIVVDDGSTDNTAALVKGFQTDTRIQLIQQPNGGVSDARNKGISVAKSKYIAFLDADDAFLVKNLELKYNALEANSEFDFVYSDMWLCDKELNDQKVLEGIEADNLFKEVVLWERETIPCLPSNIVIKREKLGGALLFDTNLSNCADRYMKILIAKKLKGRYIHEPLLKYRDTPGSMSKKVWLLEHDEKYIMQQIKEKNIIPPGSFRRRVFGNTFVILSGSWYKEGQNVWKALSYGFKALAIYPPSLAQLLKRLF
jgi:glycosyltransferase involved in cell wall biosynthesis